MSPPDHSQSSRQDESVVPGRPPFAIVSMLIILAVLVAPSSQAARPVDNPPIDVLTHAPDVTVNGHFGRMFHLPPFAPPTNAVRDALLELGRADGILDAVDDL